MPASPRGRGAKKRPKIRLSGVFSCEEISPLLYAYQTTLTVTLVVFHASFRTKPLERKPMADESKWFVALVAALCHVMHRNLKSTHVVACARANATAMANQPYKVWLRSSRLTRCRRINAFSLGECPARGLSMSFTKGIYETRQLIEQTSPVISNATSTAPPNCASARGNNCKPKP